MEPPSSQPLERSGPAWYNHSQPPDRPAWPGIPGFSGDPQERHGAVQPPCAGDAPSAAIARSGTPTRDARCVDIAPDQHGAVDIIVADPAWYRLIPRADALARRAAHAAGLTGTVVLGSDRMVRDLNARHRGRNKPTNVLTYEQPAPEIILACGVVRAEAAAQNRRPAHHMAHLVVHGALHLDGEDHHHPGDARRMEMAESRILHRIGVPNPWKRA